MLCVLSETFHITSAQTPAMAEMHLRVGGQSGFECSCLIACLLTLIAMACMAHQAQGSPLLQGDSGGQARLAAASQAGCHAV